MKRKVSGRGEAKDEHWVGGVLISRVVSTIGWVWLWERESGPFHSHQLVGLLLSCTFIIVCCTRYVDIIWLC